MAFTNEQLIKAKNAKSVEELRKLAEENGVNMSLEELEAKYNALSDNELSNVSGGCGEDPKPTETQGYWTCGNYKPRSGSYNDETAQFYTGNGCVRCYHFSTSPDKRALDPSYGGGTGYCFYGIK